MRFMGWGLRSPIVIRPRRYCTWCGRRMRRRVQNLDSNRFDMLTGRPIYRWMWCCEDYFARSLMQVDHEHDAEPCKAPRRAPVGRELVYA